MPIAANSLVVPHTPPRRNGAAPSHASQQRRAWLGGPFHVLPALALLFAAACTQSVGTRSVTLLGPGVINDPKNKSLRFDILKFGLANFCSEMQTRGVALKLSDDHPVMGRFFARACQADVIDDENKRTFVVKYSGVGYTWTNLTGRVGFDVLGAVELMPDFQLASDNSMYVYFRSSRVDVTQMNVTLVESSTARSAATLANPNQIGRDIIQAQLGRGFTVIRADSSGQTDFTQGMLPLGQKPFHPFQVKSEDPTLANERTEIHKNQQDFVGAFEVESNNRALAVAVSVDGAPAVRLSLISASAGQQLVDRYVHAPGVASPTEPPRYDQVVQYGGLFRQIVPVPQGSYYLVLQHASSTSTTPAAAANDDRAAKIDYLVQLVDAP